MYTVKFETFLFDQFLKKYDMFYFIKLVGSNTFNQDFKVPHKKKKTRK